MQSSYYDYISRQQAAAQHQQAMQSWQHANSQYAAMQGFAQQAAANRAAQEQARANDATAGLQQYEAAMQANREMSMAEREQQLKYEQMARETAAREQDSQLKYQAMNNQTNMMPGIVGSLGQSYQQTGQQAVPATNLFDRNGGRVGGGDFSGSLKRSLMG